MALILIVDDSPTEVHVMKKALEKSGYQTATANDGAEGVRMAREMTPDLIFMDVVMPRVNGYQATRTLTRDECPVYEQSASCPGAFLATCHSGVTLAAAHATDLAAAIQEPRIEQGIRVREGARAERGEAPAPSATASPRETETVERSSTSRTTSSIRRRSTNRPRPGART